RRRHTRCLSDWSSDVCSSDLLEGVAVITLPVVDLADEEVAFRVDGEAVRVEEFACVVPGVAAEGAYLAERPTIEDSNRLVGTVEDRKSTRLNSSHLGISYAVF